jgi:phenylpropionate dioxygenase-like ring-hydroxylating dioxygenase large terminal subunit
MADADPSVLARSIEIVENRLPDLAERFMQVPLAYYRDKGHDERERQLFMTQPRPIAASSEIANPDDFMVRMSMGRSILVTRDVDGKAHAFLNYCRHRGAEPASGCGNARRHSCPYHAWTYNSKGELVAMPLADRNAALDYSQLGLVELPSEERHGFLWAILTPGIAIDVAAHLGEVDAQLAALGLDKMQYRNALPLEPISANWKCVAEGVVESLHVPFVHRGTFNIDPGTQGERFVSSAAIDMAIYDRFGPHIRYSLPAFGWDSLDEMREQRDEGRPFDWRQVVQVWLLSPGVLIANDSYGLDIGFMEPGPTTDSAYFRYGWMGPAQPPGNFPPFEEMVQRAGAAVREDAPVWEGCGRGLALGGHDYALIGKNEKGVQLFHEALAAQTGYAGLRYI